MILSLAGYMGCGKSHISKVLHQKTGFRLIDLDREIVVQNGTPIPDIFRTKGEIFFRKEERRILEETLSRDEDIILSLGGGTPAYYDNITVINAGSTSFFLRATVATLTIRLSRQQAKRPLIADIPAGDLPQFISKHLFERNPYYAQCLYTVDTDGKLPETIAGEIIRLAAL